MNQRHKTFLLVWYFWIRLLRFHQHRKPKLYLANHDAAKTLAASRLLTLKLKTHLRNFLNYIRDDLDFLFLEFLTDKKVSKLFHSSETWQHFHRKWFKVAFTHPHNNITQHLSTSLLSSQNVFLSPEFVFFMGSCYGCLGSLVATDNLFSANMETIGSVFFEAFCF